MTTWIRSEYDVQGSDLLHNEKLSRLWAAACIGAQSLGYFFHDALSDKVVTALICDGTSDFAGAVNVLLLFLAFGILSKRTASFCAAPAIILVAALAGHAWLTWQAVNVLAVATHLTLLTLVVLFQAVPPAASPRDKVISRKFGLSLADGLALR